MANESNNALAGFLLGSMFGGNLSDMFGLPLNKFKKAGESEASSAENNLALQNKYADYAAQSALNTSSNAKRESANQDMDTYKQKQGIDSQTQLINLQNQAFVQDRHGFSGGSLSGYSDGNYDYIPEVYGSPFSPKVRYNKRDNPERVKMQMTAKMQEEAKAKEFHRSFVTADRDRYNQQLINEQQNAQQSNLARITTGAQTEAARIAAQAQLGAATLGAQGNILSSLFGSVSSGSPNYRYW